MKMTGTNGEISYSNVVMIKTQEHAYISLSPNPANNTVKVNGSFQKGIISVINSNGQTLLSSKISALSLTLDISRLPAGLYVVRFSDQTNSINKKLVIRHR